MYGYLNYCYAKALFDLSLDNIDHVYNDVTSFMKILKENYDIISFFSNYIISIENKVRIINSFKGYLNDTLLRFIYVIINDRRSTMLFNILESFIKIVKKYKREIDVEITSYSLLTEKDIANIVSYLSNKYDKVNIISNNIDTTILGGFIIKIESVIIDASLNSRLHDLLTISKI